MSQYTPVPNSPQLCQVKANVAVPFRSDIFMLYQIIMLINAFYSLSHLRRRMFFLPDLVVSVSSACPISPFGSSKALVTTVSKSFSHSCLWFGPLTLLSSLLMTSALKSQWSCLAVYFSWPNSSIWSEWSLLPWMISSLVSEYLHLCFPSAFGRSFSISNILILRLRTETFYSLSSFTPSVALLSCVLRGHTYACNSKTYIATLDLFFFFNLLLIYWPCSQHLGIKYSHKSLDLDLTSEA